MSNLKKLKVMKHLILLTSVWVALLGVSCHETTIGYLVTEYASYDPDSLIVRRVLDNSPGEPNPEFQMYLDMGLSFIDIINMGIPERINAGEDYNRDRLGLPWASTTIQGVEGTQPRYIAIKRIVSDTGDPDAMAALLTIRGDGTFQLPTDVSAIPVGRYVVSLTFTNEGYSKDLDDCFTIIVE